MPRDRTTVPLRTNVAPELKAAVLAKQHFSGIPVAEMLRRCARLWALGLLDDLIVTPEAAGEE